MPPRGPRQIVRSSTGSAELEVFFQAPETPRTASLSYARLDPPPGLDVMDQDTDAQMAAYSSMPLLPKRGPIAPSTPELLKASSNRTGKRPAHLQLAETDGFDPRLLYDKGGLDQYIGTASSDSSFLKTPSPSYMPNTHSRFTNAQPTFLHRLKFMQAYELPHWRSIFLHTSLCLLAYPVLLVFTTVSQNRSLFWTRAIVGSGCGIVGLALGLSLIHLGRGYLEAATWATIIHQSGTPMASDGVRLRDIADTSSDPHSPWTAISLLIRRQWYAGAHRKARLSYDARPWSLFIAFFLFIVTFASMLPFLMGRIVTITTTLSYQRSHYTELSVMGDLSSTDLTSVSALAATFNNYLFTWTLSPFSSHGPIASPVSLPWHNETIHFAEVVNSQLVPGGTGLGVFDIVDTNPRSLDTPEAWKVEATESGIAPGSLLRFPRWGIRIHCEKLEDPVHNIIPLSNNSFTYVFTPRSLLQRLFAHFDKEFPPALQAPLNVSTVLQLNDTITSGADVQSLALGAAFYPNGVAHSFKSSPASMGQDGRGWVSIEAVLVRLNNTYAPNGTFPVYGDSAEDGSRIGYDAAVCLELFEPYVVEVYNSSVGVPSSTRIISKSNTLVDAEDDHGQLDQLIGERLTEGVKRELNSTGYSLAYETLHGNSVNQILKDNGRDSFYVPSPTLVSFTNGSGPTGYTELSPSYFAQARALADAGNILPYFAGTGEVVARCYDDKIRANARIENIILVSGLLGVLAIGLVAALFVPKLPLNVPKRGFELYSWIAAFVGDELVNNAGRPPLERSMPLKDIEERMGNMKFRYRF